MTQFANGGLITGPGNDPTPIFTETMLALWPDGYVLSARQVRELGAATGFMAKLNAPKGVNQLLQEAFDYAASMSPEQVDAEYAARRAVYVGKHRA